MPLTPKFTLTQFLIEERRRHPEATGDFNSVILNVAMAVSGSRGPFAI
jgi:fructose-1,6-bisphosphatase I/sedoheptulose-1,7-bisphosphatase